MRKIRSLVMLFLVPFLALLCGAQSTDCAQFNFSMGPFSGGATDATGHGCSICNGNHGWQYVFAANVVYTGTDAPCVAALNATANASVQEHGVILVPYVHDFARKFVGGTVIGPLGGGTGPANAGAVASVRKCLLTCSVNVGASGGGTIGVSLSTDPNAFISWEQTIQFPGAPGKTARVTPCQGTGGGGTKTCPQSPVAVKTRDIPWSEVFTDPHGAKVGDTCVTFDLENNNTPRCWSWIKPGRGAGWLVYLPKDANGHQGDVHNSVQLVGEHTPQPDNFLHNKNGLQFLQSIRSGQNLVMDGSDKVVRDGELMVWFDEHCYKTPELPCTSLPGELKRLDEVGLYSFSLVYGTPAGGIITDRYQNEGRLSAPANMDVIKNRRGKSEYHLQRTHDKVHELVEFWIQPGELPAKIQE